MTYIGLATMFGLVWRLIGTIREPVLKRIKERLTGKDKDGNITGGGFDNGAWLYSVFV